MEKKIILLLVAFLILWFSVHGYLAANESPTFDEPVHVKAGHQYLKGDFEFDPMEPPLLRVLSVWPSQMFGFENRLDYLNYRVVPIVINGLLLVLLLWLIGQRCGVHRAALAGGMMLVDPNILAYGHLVITDMTAAVLIMISMLCLHFFPRSRWWMFFVALAAAAKISSLAYLVIVILAYWWQKKIDLKAIAVMTLIGAMVVWGSYGFRFQPLLSESRVHNGLAGVSEGVKMLAQMKLPLGGYLQGMKENWQFSQRGQPLFFAGNVYIKGPWWKQAVDFILKTPWPILILLPIACIRAKEKQWLLSLAGFIILNGIVALHFGMRHQLVLTLLTIIVIVGSRLSNWLIGIAMVISLFLVWGAWPYPMTYSNHTSPVLIHSDSDYDWGQGLIRLKRELGERNIGKIQLAYFGNANPGDYGIDYVRIRDMSLADGRRVMERAGDLPVVISVTCFQMCGYANERSFSDRVGEEIGGSFLLFR